MTVSLLMDGDQKEMHSQCGMTKSSIITGVNQVFTTSVMKKHVFIQQVRTVIPNSLLKKGVRTAGCTCIHKC